MGLSLLETLITQLDHFESVNVLNRGNNYWDNKAHMIYAKFPKIKHWKIDRDKPKYGELIGELCNKQTTVVDFCAYSVPDLMSVLKGVKELKQYIYISSDSVYEATSLYRILESPNEVIETTKLQRERLDKLEEKSEDGQAARGGQDLEGAACSGKGQLTREQAVTTHSAPLCEGRIL